MRIIGGEAKGRRYSLPKGYKIRPTTDFIKEVIFNTLPCFEGRPFLDLYAGTGSIGLEALSRGAGQVVFVESNPGLAKYLKQLLGDFPFGEKGEVLCLDVQKALSDLAGRGAWFDIIFADPPYNEGYAFRTISCISDIYIKGKMILKGLSLLILQHSAAEPAPQIEPLVLFEQKKHGDNVLSYFHIEQKETSKCKK